MNQFVNAEPSFSSEKFVYICVKHKVPSIIIGSWVENYSSSDGRLMGMNPSRLISMCKHLPWLSLRELEFNLHSVRISDSHSLALIHHKSPEHPTAHKHQQLNLHAAFTSRGCTKQRLF